MDLSMRRKRQGPEMAERKFLDARRSVLTC